MLDIILYRISVHVTSKSPDQCIVPFRSISHLHINGLKQDHAYCNWK